MAQTGPSIEGALIPRRCTCQDEDPVALINELIDLIIVKLSFILYLPYGVEEGGRSVPRRCPWSWL